MKHKNLIAFVIFLFTAAVYAFTWGPLFMGYEKETAMSALALWHGSLEVYRAGLMTIFMYQPFVALGSLFPSHMETILTLVPLFYSAATASILFLILCKLTKKITAPIVLSALIAIGSLMWPYSRIGMEYSAMFFLALLALALLHWAFDNGSPLLVGAALAGAVLTKSYGILFTVPTTLFIIVVLRETGRVRHFFSWKFLAQVFGLAAAGVLAVMTGNYHLYGRLQGVYSLGQEFQVWSWWEGWFGTFFSFGKSIFIYSPLLLISVFYWPAFWRKHRAPAVFVLAMFAMLLLITVPFSFWSDETLGVRKLMPILPLLHLPLLFVFEEKLGRWKYIFFGLLLAASLYIQLINSLYPYWRQLELLRPYSLDNLPTIRYAPELTSIPMNNRFFTAFITSRLFGRDSRFHYLERSWMRCCTYPPAADIFVARIDISLSAYARPDTYLFDRRLPAVRRRAYGVFDLAVIALSGGWLVRKWRDAQKTQNMLK